MSSMLFLDKKAILENSLKYGNTLKFKQFISFNNIPLDTIYVDKFFKEMIMLCQTEKGKQVRLYYLDMVEVMELYLQYQNTVVIQQGQCQITDLTAEVRNQSAQIQKLLGFATETKKTLGETKKTLGETKEEITKVSNKLDRAIPNRVVYTGVPRNQRESTYVYQHNNFEYGIEYEYHMFRCQKRSIKSCIKNRIRTLWRQRRESSGNPNSRPSVPILEEINMEKYFDDQPNPVMFWTRFAKYMERIGAIELNPANKMQFSMVVE